MAGLLCERVRNTFPAPAICRVWLAGTARRSSNPALPRPPCREAEYTEYRPLRLFVGTWNVNGKTPRESLTPWLNDGVDADAEGRLDLPDIYVIG